MKAKRRLDEGLKKTRWRHLIKALKAAQAPKKGEAFLALKQVGCIWYSCPLNVSNSLLSEINFQALLPTHPRCLPTGEHFLCRYQRIFSLGPRNRVHPHYILITDQFLWRKEHLTICPSEPIFTSITHISGNTVERTLIRGEPVMWLWQVMWLGSPPGWKNFCAF